MQHKKINDRKLRALKPAPKGTTADHWDLSFPKFGVRVSETGRKTFVLMTRYPGSPDPTRRALGVYGPMTLADAHEKARGWLKLIEKQIDPKEEEGRRKHAEQKRRKNTFTSVAEDFIVEKLATERKGKEAETDLRRVFIPEWGGRPITDITELDVLGIIKAKAKTAPVRARNLLALLKRFFGWAIDQRVYEIQSSPCERLKPTKIFGERNTRQHELKEAELFAYWRTVDRLRYPYGPVYKLLLLTGLRLNEVAGAQWSEFDPAVIKELRKDKPNWGGINKDKLRWIIPKERMKGRNSKARAHAVPLIPEILAVLERLPRQSGDYVFSTSGGKQAAWIGDKIKKQLDRRMLLTLRAQAKVEGEDRHKVKLEHWTNHDLRRVIRSGMSRLRVSDAVAEAVLAHTAGIIQKTYNVDDLFSQKAEALAAWAGHLRSIVTPSANVVSLAKARA
jgi:integrase